MLALFIYVTSFLALVYMEVIYNIQCYLFKSKHCFTEEETSSNTYNKKHQVICTATMLEYLVIHNSFVSDVYMDDMAYMKQELCHLHLEQ